MKSNEGAACGLYAAPIEDDAAGGTAPNRGGGRGNGLKWGNIGYMLPQEP
jgi:hypothetical protein